MELFDVYELAVTYDKPAGRSTCASCSAMAPLVPPRPPFQGDRLRIGRTYRS